MGNVLAQILHNDLESQYSMITYSVFYTSNLFLSNLINLSTVCFLISILFFFTFSKAHRSYFYFFFGSMCELEGTAVK